MSASQDPSAIQAALFGNYKAEWLRERIFDLFTTPSYFPDLETSRPCVLIGGRGTGKTTVLRCLSYEGKFVLSNNDTSAIRDWQYFGFYYRVDQNKVTAFDGPELDRTTWNKLFAHYVNLLLCGHILRFLHWYNLRLPQDPQLPPEACERVATTLHIESFSDTNELLRGLEHARLKFEAFLNNLRDDRLPAMSLQGAGIEELLKHVTELPQFVGKSFFFLIDEYENFTDDQQIVLNTLIKHSGELFTFKVGVRELGWRVKSTLNKSEQLTSPADYARINIEERLGDRFGEFARTICNQRLKQIGGLTDDQPIEYLLPGISEDEEAARLGIRELVSVPSVDWPSDMSDRQRFYAINLASYHNITIEDVLLDRSIDAAAWTSRFSNYGHHLLFSLRKRKAGLRKYYSGWRTYVYLSRTNIRYLLELVDQALALHRDEGNAFGSQISIELQTKAAQLVGKKNLTELEGVSVNGAQLTRLVLGLGRVFNVLAQEMFGHGPEVTQFSLKDNELAPDVVNLLTSAVMHLALVRESGTKLSDETDVKSYNYSLHPVYAPFFGFSYRRKRKISLSGDQVLGLVKTTKETIRGILGETDAPLPEQLQLFGAYYGNAS